MEKHCLRLKRYFQEREKNVISSIMSANTVCLGGSHWILPTQVLALWHFLTPCSPTSTASLMINTGSSSPGPKWVRNPWRSHFQIHLGGVWLFAWKKHKKAFTGTGLRDDLIILIKSTIGGETKVLGKEIWLWVMERSGEGNLGSASGSAYSHHFYLDQPITLDLGITAQTLWMVQICVFSPRQAMHRPPCLPF